MINLRGVAPDVALKLALANTTKTPTQISEEMGWGKSVSARVFCSGNYFPKYADIPRFCDVVGNGILIVWLLKNRRYAELASLKPMDALSLLKSLGVLLKEMSDVSAKGQQALIDWKISKREAHGIIREIRDVLEVGCYMMSRLSSVVDGTSEHIKKDY